MVDVVSFAVRSRMMTGIRGKHTLPELMIRSMLHKAGYRFRLHDKKLPGKPDIVLNKYHAVIQVQGCFWHGHKCHLFKWPKTRVLFWQKKILANISNDSRAKTALLSMGWKLLVVWECALKGRGKVSSVEIFRLIDHWIKSNKPYAVIEGDNRNG